MTFGIHDSIYFTSEKICSSGLAIMQRRLMIFSRGEGEIIELLCEKHVKVFYPSLGFFFYREVKFYVQTMTQLEGKKILKQDLNFYKKSLFRVKVAPQRIFFKNLFLKIKIKRLEGAWSLFLSSLFFQGGTSPLPPIIGLCINVKICE